MINGTEAKGQVQCRNSYGQLSQCSFGSITYLLPLGSLSTFFYSCFAVVATAILIKKKDLLFQMVLRDKIGIHFATTSSATNTRNIKPIIEG